MGTMTVTIPGRVNHEGLYKIQVTIADTCPVCGSKRGHPFGEYSYDGSRRMAVDAWQNPCGHVDKYSDVRSEAMANGLNGVK